MPKIKTIGLVTLLYLVGTAFESAFISEFPLSLTALAYLPVIFHKDRRFRIAMLVSLVCMESLFSRVPILAGFSMIVVIETILELLETEFKIFSPVVAFLALPLIEVSRQFWVAIFAALYDLPAPPQLNPTQVIYSGFAGLLIFFMMQALGFNREQTKAVPGW